MDSGSPPPFFTSLFWAVEERLNATSNTSEDWFVKSGTVRYKNARIM
jgi:hypothetical protein